MKEQPITLESLPLITGRLNAMGMHISEFSFPNLYLFRKTHEYKIMETASSIFISGLSYDKKRYCMPLTRPENADPDCFSTIKEILRQKKAEFIFPIPEEWRECFPEEEFNHNYNPNDSDYLYLTEKFKTYPGKALHRKKNQLNQFLRLPNPLMVQLTPATASDAKQILSIWQEQAPQDADSNDYHPCLEAIEKLQQLNLTGAIAYADGRPAGFIIGEPLNQSTFTIHFAKADIQYRGIYQFLFSSFANSFCPAYQYINLEQDLGSEGLRKTKTSYRPALMAHKYRIGLR